MDGNNSSKRQIIAALAVLIVIVVIVAAVGVAAKKENSSSSDLGATSVQPTTSTDSSSASTDTSTTTTNGTYTDGTYEATGTYNTPGGTDTMAVLLTIQSGVVTAATATTDAPDHESEEYDTRFLAAYKQYVVGKNVNDISLSRISGASLTTQGFTSALQKIASEAQA